MSSGLVLPGRRHSPVALFGGDVPTLIYSDPAKGGDGSLRINPDKLNVDWQWIAGQLNGQFPFKVPAGSIGTRATLTVGAQDGKTDGDFEVSTIFLNSSASRIAVQPTVTTPTFSRALSNGFIHYNLMSGTSQLPGLLPQSIYCLPKTSWDFLIHNNIANVPVNTNVSPVLFGRRFSDCGADYVRALRQRAEMLRWIHPYWITPDNPNSRSAVDDPVFSTAPGGDTLLVTFRTKSDADFLLCAMLDDSDNGARTEPDLFANVQENISGRSLIDFPSTTNPGGTALGIKWRDFLAVPSIAVAGFPSGFPAGTIRAFSFANQYAGWSHLVPRNSQIVIRFTSTDVNSISIRVALFGFCVYAREAPDRILSVTDRAAEVRQADEYVRALGVQNPFGGGR